MKQNRSMSLAPKPGSTLAGTLARVDLSDGEIVASSHAWTEFGRLKENFAQATLTNFLLVEKLDRVKNTKLYRSWDFATWEEFIQKTFPFSVDTADRMIKDLRELGRGWFDLNDVLRVTRQAFRLVNPEFTDKGEIVLAGEKFALNKANSDAIQMAFTHCESEMRRKGEENSGLKADLEKVRVERDNAKKAAVEASRKLRDAQSPRIFADADEDQQVMLRVQSNWDAGIALMAKLRDRELSPENEARYLGLCEYMYRSLLQVVDESRARFGRGENMPDPGDSLWLNNEPDTSRNLIQEHIEKGVKK